MAESSTSKVDELTIRQQALRRERQKALLEGDVARADDLLREIEWFTFLMSPDNIIPLPKEKKKKKQKKTGIPPEAGQQVNVKGASKNKSAQGIQAEQNIASTTCKNHEKSVASENAAWSVRESNALANGSLDAIPKVFNLEQIGIGLTSSVTNPPRPVVPKQTVAAAKSKGARPKEFDENGISLGAIAPWSTFKNGPVLFNIDEPLPTIKAKKGHKKHRYAMFDTVVEVKIPTVVGAAHQTHADSKKTNPSAGVNLKVPGNGSNAIEPGNKISADVAMKKNENMNAHSKVDDTKISEAKLFSQKPGDSKKESNEETNVPIVSKISTPSNVQRTPQTISTVDSRTKDGNNNAASKDPVQVPVSTVQSQMSQVNPKKEDNKVAAPKVPKPSTTVPGTLPVSVVPKTMNAEASQDQKAVKKKPSAAPAVTQTVGDSKQQNISAKADTKVQSLMTQANPRTEDIKDVASNVPKRSSVLPTALPVSVHPMTMNANALTDQKVWEQQVLATFTKAVVESRLKNSTATADAKVSAKIPSDAQLGASTGVALKKQEFASTSAETPVSTGTAKNTADCVEPTKAQPAAALKKNWLPCRYCAILCNSLKQFEEHCASKAHNAMVNSSTNNSSPVQSSLLRTESLPSMTSDAAITRPISTGIDVKKREKNSSSKMTGPTSVTKRQPLIKSSLIPAETLVSLKVKQPVTSSQKSAEAKPPANGAKGAPPKVSQTIRPQENTAKPLTSKVVSGPLVTNNLQPQPVQPVEATANALGARSKVPRDPTTFAVSTSSRYGVLDEIETPVSNKSQQSPSSGTSGLLSRPWNVAEFSVQSVKPPLLPFKAGGIYGAAPNQTGGILEAAPNQASGILGAPPNQADDMLGDPFTTVRTKAFSGSSRASSISNLSDISFGKNARSRSTSAVRDNKNKKKPILPLNPSCEYRMMCRNCFKPNETAFSNKQHACREDMLVVKQRNGGIWVHIRERINHREFRGQYLACKFAQSGHRCWAGDNCSFAHTKEEQTLWTLEKDAKFSITAFIVRARSTESSLYTVESIMERYPGRMQMLCRLCLLSDMHRLSSQHPRSTTQCAAGHDWLKYKQLVHFDSNDHLTLVSPRPSKDFTFFLMCRYKQFCNSRETCHKAHSALERDVWYLERDAPELTSERLVEQSKRRIPSRSSTPAGMSRASSVASLVTPSADSSDDKCPYQVMECCSLCHNNGASGERSSTAASRCQSGRHQFEMNKMFLILPSKKKLDKVPYSQTGGKMCSYMENNKKCMNSTCTYAHSKEELQVWAWMKKHGVTEREQLLKRQPATAHRNSASPAPTPRSHASSPRAPPSQSAWAPAPATEAMPLVDLNASLLFCRYCSVTCNSEVQLERHCASTSHKAMVNSDKEHPWNHRPPPLRVKRFTLCGRHKNGMKCRFSRVPDANNLCEGAHSEEELDEWIERYKWRRMKRDNARHEKLFSYIDRLSDDFEKAESGLTVMSENLDYVNIRCSTRLAAFSSDKRMKHSWIFNLTTTRDQQLTKVALLDPRDCLHFSLSGGGVTTPGCQLDDGDRFVAASRDGTNAYAVTVEFVGGLYGTFTQWVTFDFGQRPVLYRKITMELGSRELQEKVVVARERLQFDRWTDSNRKIIRNEARPLSELNARLLIEYKPSCADEVITQESITTEINKNNYVHRMHNLLNMEELEQARIIANYNIKTTIDVTNVIEDTTHLFSLPGEFYAKLQLNTELNEDTDAGNLLLRIVSSVLLAKSDSADGVVYQVDIVKRDNTGLGRDYLYLFLSKRVCEALKLKKDDKLEVEVQFQMDRLFFCQMHYAVDNIENNLEVVFPDQGKLRLPLSETYDQKQGGQRQLNKEQLRIMQYCCQTGRTRMPPLVVYGPFGTGKTETIAQSALLLARQDTSVKVLICTHTNSAADEYIKRFAPDATSRPIRILRLYDIERRLETVPAVVQPFCLLSDDQRSFRAPTERNIHDSQIVVVTLVGSLVVTKLNIKGVFSHVFIDEAAQVEECEAIMPLSLVGERTCVVLAGDHRQMGLKVYSAVARQQNFHLSLLERLNQYYKESVGHQGMQTIPAMIILTANYRNHPDINFFVSRTFYGDNVNLSSKTGDSPVPGLAALNFYAAQGREVQDSNSTSFYNPAEIEEVVERVNEFLQNWPVAEWGEREPKHILVTAPYSHQILRLRAALRKRNRELGGVTVVGVQNVPGLEFRAVFISIVRTRHLIENHAEGATGFDTVDGVDYGFLSEPKLVNSALTRAKSFVAVVGDPVALCSIGECKEVWKQYLKKCTIHTADLTFQGIRQQCELVRAAYELPGSTAAAQAVSERTTRSDIVYSRTGGDESSGLPPSGVTMRPAPTMLNPNAAPFNVAITVLPEPSAGASSGPDYWTEEFRMEPDEIILQLAEAARKQQQPQGAVNAVAQAPIWPILPNNIFLQEQRGHALLGYQQADEDRGAPLDPGGDYTVDELRELLRTDPRRYKRCILDLESPSGRYAKPLDQPLQYRKINLASRKKCGRGFHSDEVVVEVYSEAGADGDRLLEPFGEVVGILKQGMDPRYRLFVCQVEEHNTGLMVPLNVGIPKIFNVEFKDTPGGRRRVDNLVHVYSMEHRDRVVFRRHVEVNPLDRSAQLFVMRYLKWEKGFNNPLGIVVDVIEPGYGIPQAMKILNIDHNIPTKFPNAVVDTVTRDYGRRYAIPTSANVNRLDLRDRLVFTVDPPESTDLDDALSIEILPNDRFMIGVHIADASFYVQPGSSIDKEAEKRATSYYPFGLPHVPMLPSRLSSDLCSLLPGKDRLTLSVFFTIDCLSDITDVEFRRCVVRSQYRLTYAEAESIIVGADDVDSRFSQDLVLSIQTLSEISKMWAKRRLGKGPALYHQPKVGEMGAPNAHAMIEQFMIVTNHQVALRLMRSFPSCVPLRQQVEPNALELDQWRARFTDDARNSATLSKPYLRTGVVCQCVGLCTCIPGDVSADRKMEIARSTWDEILAAVGSENFEALRSLVICPEYHPQLALALLAFQSLNSRSQYVCSGDLSADEMIHYSLNVGVYVQFTSPIRRYIDIVAHRLLIAAIEQNPTGENPCPYPQERVTEICIHCTDAASRARKYEQATTLANFCGYLQDKPILFHPVVYKAEDVSFQLRFPLFRALIPNRTAIPVNALNPSTKPTTTIPASTVGLRWSQRIYDMADLPNEEKSRNCNLVGLNAERYIAKAASSAWRQLVQAAIGGNQNEIVNAVNDIGPRFNNVPSMEKLTSEGAIISNNKHFCEYTLDVRAASILKVQLTTELNRGLLVPTVQLLCLTDTAHICVEHNKSPVECFADVSAGRATRNRYDDIEEYQSLWLPVLAIASSSGAVKNEFSAIVHHVSIKWTEYWSDNRGLICIGSFKVPVDFCKQRYIKVMSEKKPVDDDADDIDEHLLFRSDGRLSEKSFAYVCVRYMNLKIPAPTSKMAERLAGTSEVEEPITWVGHCVAVRATVDSDKKMCTVYLRVNQSSSSLPRQLVSHESKAMASIEWIGKPTTDRRLEEAVVNLPVASFIVQNIALGRNPLPLDATYAGLIHPWLDKPIPGLDEPNVVQSDAIRHALSRPFSLILGPPGTGKTVVAVRIAYMLAQINKTLGKEFLRTTDNAVIKPQVMVCGPSNKSADVVAGYLKKLNAPDLKLVRVYSTKKEQIDYPIPRQLVLIKKVFKLASKVQDLNLRGITLHHMIRDDNENPYSAKKLRDMDERIGTDPDGFTDEEVKAYREEITMAELFVLQHADIIFMTCSAAGARRTHFAMNILQLIIDECGMCTEPESFVPLVKTRAKHIILVGDDKQLQPIIPEPAAEKRGLDRSLFNRYSKGAFMLTTHYRMHEAIAEFPSQKFYENRLEVGREEQRRPSSLQNFWPGGPRAPIAFVHVVGVEASLAVSTDEGSQQSKSNQTEVQLLVRIVKEMVGRHHIEQKHIAVLSQYRAQCAEITKKFASNKLDDITVGTVVASQGSEWEYVILATARSMPEVEIEKDPSASWKRKHLGFISDPHQANVAMTRAQKGLIILGNKSLLRCDEMWKQLIAHYAEKQALVNAADFVTRIANH